MVFFLTSIAFKNGVTRTICVAANAKPFYYNAYIYNGGQNMGGGRAIENPVVGFSYIDKIDSVNSIKIQLQACFFGVGTRLKIYGYKR